MKILDVSKFQPKIDYAVVAKQVEGVILRCGFTGWGIANECQKDPLFEQHYAGFKAQGVPVGVYYYSAADTVAKAKEEAEFVKSLLIGKELELPVYYDIEEPNRMDKLSKEQLTNQVTAWCESLEQAGYFVGVYANTNYFQNKLNTAVLAQKYTLWLADYRKNYNTTLPRDMHQYTSTARIEGIVGGVDMSDLFRTDIINIIKQFGFNGFVKQPPNNSTVKLYKVKFGECSVGDKGTALVLAQKLGLNVRVFETKNNLYVVEYNPVTNGDKEAIKQLGERLTVPVIIEEVK